MEMSRKIKFDFKKLTKIFVMVVVLVVGTIPFMSCKNSAVKNQDVTVDEASTNKNLDEQLTIEDIYDFDKNYKDRKVIVAYFSATGNTKNIAEKIAGIFECDTVEIEPVKPYTEKDLTSSDPSTRPMRESMFDPLSPPEEPEEDKEIDPNIVTSLPAIRKKNLTKYNTIILGYPIWYGDAPRVIYTFVSENNLKDKIIIPFCTSDNDDIDLSVNKLSEFSDANFMSGKRFDKNASETEIKEFFTEIGASLDVWD